MHERHFRANRCLPWNRGNVGIVERTPNALSNLHGQAVFAAGVVVAAAGQKGFDQPEGERLPFFQRVAGRAAPEKAHLQPVGRLGTAAFLGAPHLDALFDEPLHHKGGLIGDAPDAVKHEHQQDVELFLFGQLLDDLQLVAVLCPDLMPGNAFLLFLMDDGSAHFVTEGVAGFPLHGDAGLVFVVVVHLFVGGNTIQCANSVFHGLSSFHLLYGQKEDATIRILCRFQGAQC